MIDEYTRYPEVEFTKSTSAQAVIPHIDWVFSTHGFPDSVKTDGGPPFNGSGSHEYQMYMKWAGVKTIVVSPEGPEANGLAENFMKPLSKVWDTAHIEGKECQTRYTISCDTTGQHRTQPLAKPRLSSCSTTTTQCAFQSYRSQYMTPNTPTKCTSQSEAKGLQGFQNEC